MSRVCEMPMCDKPVHGLFKFCSGLCRVNHRKLADPDYTAINDWDDEDSADPWVAFKARRKRESLAKPKAAQQKSRRKSHGKRRRPRVNADGVRFCVHCKTGAINHTAGNSALYCSAKCRREDDNARSRKRYAEGTRRASQ